MPPELTLTCFRNHASLRLELAPRTALVGPNGAGKTAALEALSMLSLTTSWKAESDAEVVSWGAEAARIEADGRVLAVRRTPYLKRFTLDGIPKRVGEVVGTFPSVLFQPDDAAIVYGSPATRRQALDRLLSQTAPGYLAALTRLQRVVKQRNRLLKRIQDGEASAGELPYWDAQLAGDGILVSGSRAAAMPLLESEIRRLLPRLLPETAEFAMPLHRSPSGVSTKEEYSAHLAKNLSKELAAGSSLYGPHREDFRLEWNGHQVSETLSRGQVRGLVLAFKLAELHVLELSAERPPLLLMDDVFSEFDRERRALVTELTLGYPSVLTATELDGAPPGDLLVHDLTPSLTAAP